MTGKIRKDPSISFKFDNGKVNVRWGVVTAYKPQVDGGFACYLPAYDIYFSASNFETIEKKSMALTRLYLHHFLRDSKNGVKLLILELHKLGFKAPNDAFTIKQLISNKQINSKFKSQGLLPNQFENAALSEQEANMVVEAA